MSRRARRETADYPTYPYDLVKEGAVAFVLVLALVVVLAAVFSSPDKKAITMKDWAAAAPDDVVATATAELAGTSGSAGYGGPYNHGSPGVKLGPLSLQRWAGVTIPVSSADLVLQPLRDQVGMPAVSAAVQQWTSATADQQSGWANAYADALANAPDGDPAKVAAGDYGPVPALADGLLQLARTGGLEGALASSGTFYGTDATRSLLLLSDGAYLEDRARAEHLGGDQWGMMNETGNYPGQPWLWLYTFWYQVKPFSTSDNADALVWGLMVVLTAGLALVPWIPGLRDIPRWVPVHKLIWREHYRRQAAR